MDNEAKIFTLLEKIYVELQDTKQELRDTKQELKTDIQKIEVKIENEVLEKIRGLYDHREIVNEKLACIDEKIDKLQIDVNNLSIKTTTNDTRIIELAQHIKKAK